MEINIVLYTQKYPGLFLRRFKVGVVNPKQKFVWEFKLAEVSVYRMFALAWLNCIHISAFVKPL